MARTCICGSGKPRFEIVDARGIFCTYACDDCEARKRAAYRADVLSNPQYEADEPIEED
jgi:hypothetical protein